MAVALVDLDGAAPGPDRFADAARLAVRGDVFVDEHAPGGNDPGGIAAERLHVGETDPLGVGAQLPFQQLDLLGTDRDQRRFAGLQGTPHERHGPGQEPLGAVVEHHFVSKP